MGRDFSGDRHIAGQGGEALDVDHFAVDALRKQRVRRRVELPLHFAVVGSEIELAPAQRFRPVHHDFDCSGDRALRVNGQLGGMRGNGVFG